MTLETILARRRAERAALLERARGYVAALPPALALRGAVVFGSVARGDFNRWSDVDVLLIAERLPEHFLQRLDALEPRAPLVQPIAWTVPEWHDRLARRDPIAVEARERGVWLAGSPAMLSGR